MSFVSPTLSIVSRQYAWVVFRKKMFFWVRSLYKPNTCSYVQTNIIISMVFNSQPPFYVQCFISLVFFFFLENVTCEVENLCWNVRKVTRWYRNFPLFSVYSIEYIVELFVYIMVPIIPRILLNGKRKKKKK